MDRRCIAGRDVKSQTSHSSSSDGGDPANEVGRQPALRVFEAGPYDSVHGVRRVLVVYDAVEGDVGVGEDGGGGIGAYRDWS